LANLLLEGLALGFSTGGYCLSACMPFLIPYMLVEAKSGVFHNLKFILEFLFGRLMAYIIFAFVISVLGQNFHGLVFSKILSIAMIISALLMLVYAFAKNFPKLHFCIKIDSSSHLSKMPFFLGFLIGINICPPFLIGMVKLLELASVAKGMVYFLGFFIGTAFYTLPLLSLTWVVKIKRLQNIGNITAFIVGAWFLMIGIISLLR